MTTTVDRQAAGVPRPSHWLRRVAVSTALAAVFGWLALRMVRPDMGALRAAIGALDLRAFGLFLAIVYVAQAVRTLRWAALLRPLGTVPLRRLVPISFVGYLAAFTVPTLGEVVRPYLVGERGGLRASAALASVVVERILDGLLVALLTFVALLPLSLAVGAPWWLRGVAFGSLGLFLGVAVVLAVLHWKREAAVAAIARVLAPLSPRLATRATSTLHSFLDGLGALPSRRVALEVVSLTLVYWTLNGFGFQVLAAGFGIDLDLRATWATIGIIVYSFLVPALGQIGTYHSFCLLGLGLFLPEPVLRGAGVALAVTMHATQVAVFGTAGLLALFSPEVRWARRNRTGAPGAGAAGAALVALLLLAPGVASAKTARRFDVPVDTLWSVALRFIRVDRGYEVRDKDKEAGYVLFDWAQGDKKHPASLEIFVSGPEGKREVRAQVRCDALPGYEEIHFLDRLGEKLREDGADAPGGKK